MDWMNGDILYKGGILIAAVAAISMLVYIVVSCMFVSRIKKQLIREYGEIVANKRMKWQK